MAVALTSWAVQFELAGVGGGWSDVTADVLLGAEPLRFRYGIAAGGPSDRVADTGWCTFALNNDVTNSGGLLGYYSPLHANVRAGFTWGIGVRIKFVYAAVTYYKWMGKIAEIDPVPGTRYERITRIRCVDWMDEAAQFNVRDVSIQLSKRSDQVFSAVLAAMPKQPAATSVGVGLDTYPYSLDDIGDHPSAVSVFQKITQSELGFIYVKGDSVQGGTLVYENRQTRILAGSVNLSTLTNTQTKMSVPRTLAQLYNRVETTVHPKSIDAAATTVLYQKPSGTTILVAAGQTTTIFGDFRDPAQSAVSLIGGTAGVAPVATTDYVANSAADGSGSNLTANFTVTATFFAATVKLVIVNTGATDGYLTTLQVRGKGIYDYGPQVSRSDAAASQASQGLRALLIDMPYQDALVNGQGAADYLLNIYSNPQTQVDAVSFASDTAALLTAALAREISDRIGLVETVTGVSTANQAGFYIQSIEMEIVPSRIGPLITCTWGLAPASGQAVLVLDQVGSSELDSVGAVLGYL